MLPINPGEHPNALKKLYSRCVGDVCVRHRISRMELDILLFLANNPLYDTATDIVDIRYLSKSQVSASIRLLEECGYIRKEYTGGNRKTAHLKICEAAAEILRDGKAAQEKFLSIMMEDFSPDEQICMKQYYDRIYHNISRYLKEEKNDF